MVRKKTPHGYIRDKNGRLKKKPTRKRKTTGGGVGSIVMAGAKILGPAILSSLLADEISKRMKKKKVWV